MSIFEDPEDLIGKSLANGFHPAKIKNDFFEFIESVQKSFGFWTGNVVLLKKLYQNPCPIKAIVKFFGGVFRKYLIESSPWAPAYAEANIGSFDKSFLFNKYVFFKIVKDQFDFVGSKGDPIRCFRGKENTLTRMSGLHRCGFALDKFSDSRIFIGQIEFIKYGIEDPDPIISDAKVESVWVKISPNSTFFRKGVINCIV